MRAFIGFVRRPPGERLLIVHVMLALMIAAIGVALLPFRWLAWFAARPGAGRVAAGPDQAIRIARVIGRQDLHARPDLRPRTDCDPHHVEDDAAEVQEYAVTDCDIVPIVTVERRPDRHGDPVAARLGSLVARQPANR